MLLAAPALWVVALIVLAWVVHEHDAVGLALIVTAASFTLWMLVLVPMRARRCRDEEER